MISNSRVNPKSISPRNAPTAPATAITMIDSRTVSSRVGQVTRRSSAIVSPTKRALNTRRLASAVAREVALVFLATDCYRTSLWSL